MNAAPLISPPGALPEAVPQGLHDLLFSPPPSAAELAQFAVHAAWQQHPALWIGLIAGLSLLVGGAVWLHRDWRGRLLRWQLTRLAQLVRRQPESRPEPVGAALHWALARYFGHRPGLDRRALPADWQPAVAELDRLRFAPRPASAAAADWLALLDSLRALSQHRSPRPAPRQTTPYQTTPRHAAPNPTEARR